MLAVLKKCGMCNVVIFLLLLAFTIGLNLGIHGALHFEVARGPGDVTSSNIGIVSSSATRPSPATMSIGLNLPTGSGNDPNLTTKNDNDPNLTTKNDNVPNVAITGSNSNYAHSPTKEPPFITRKERHGEAPVKPVQELTSPPILSIGKLGNIESYLAGGGKFPILLITCNRPDLLKITLNSLLSVIGVSASNILVVQDGSMEAVSEVVKNRGIQVVQNTRGIGLRGGAGSDGASRIASHYKFALTTAFQAFPESPGVIIVEDDLLFSPDFFEYFHAVSPILDHDKTVFALSAWSDNGFIGRVKDPYKLERTDYFPGLGWLISKELYTTELEPQWPSAHWDHWLRSEHINKNREIVHPEVPRTFHNGIKGTFMDLTMHNLYFRDIAYNINPEVSWSRHQSELGQPVYKAVIAENFESEVLAQVERCVHTKSVDEIISAPAGSMLCVWIDVAHEMATSDPPFKPISSFFGLWHEHRRGAHRGMHRFYFQDKLILLINIKFFSKKMGSYDRIKPRGAVVLAPYAFDKRKLVSNSDLALHIVEVASKEPGISCTQICASKAMRCFDAGFSYVNSCPKLQSHFPCNECYESLGSEQPAYVIKTHNENQGACLYTSQPGQSTCNAMHPATQRLCPCIAP